MNNSLMIQEYTHEQAKEFFTFAYNPQELEEINKSSLLVVSSLVKEKLDEQRMIFDFNNYETKKERNELIHEYYEKGFSQHLIAKHIGLSQVGVNKILNKK
jgi:putative transposase